MLKQQVAELLRARRALAGMSRAELAEAVKVNTKTIASIEEGRRLPSVPLLWHLSRALRVSVNDLLPPPVRRDT